MDPISQTLAPEQIGDHAEQLLRAHHRLLSDGVRNRAFHRALQKLVTSDSAVLDIGAGVGVWAIAAARLGARKVVAIEADEFLIGVIRRLAAEAGVGDRVEAIQGMSTKVQLGREFDIVVSETIGYNGFEEQIVPIMADAQSRFLREGGRIIPETVALFAAAGFVKGAESLLPRALPFAFPYYEELNLNAPRRLQRPRDFQAETPPCELIRVDLRKPPLPTVLEDLRAVWSVDEAARINCFAVWVETRLTSGVRLSTRRTTSWTPMLYPIRATPGGNATIELRLCLAGQHRWRAIVSTAGATVSQTRSPLSAGLQMLGEKKPFA